MKVGLVVVEMDDWDLDADGYNPMDDEGYQQIDVGDRVSVTGDIDIDTWEKRELMAETIVTLLDSSDS